MKKKKETLPAITQGKKGQRITVMNKLHGSDITLEVTADYETWNKFFHHIETRKADFPFDFFGSFVNPALENSKEELSQPTGKRNNQDFIDNLKVLSAILYLPLLRKHKGRKSDGDIAQTIKEIFLKVFSELIKGYKTQLSKDFYKNYIYEGMMMLYPDRVPNLLAFLNWFELSEFFREENKISLDRMRKETVTFIEGQSHLEFLRQHEHSDDFKEEIKRMENHLFCLSLRSEK